MPNNDNLIERLREGCEMISARKTDVLMNEAADRIEELEKARDMWMERVDVVTGELDREQEGSLQLAGLLKKAEAELAAARACIRWFSSGNHPWDADHRATIDAAREAL